MTAKATRARRVALCSGVTLLVIAGLVDDVSSLRRRVATRLTHTWLRLERRGLRHARHAALSALTRRLLTHPGP